MAGRIIDLVRGASRAVSQRSSSVSSQQAALQPLKMPQSQPMQRSIELLPYPDTESTPSPLSDEFLSSSSTVCVNSIPSPSCRAPASPYVEMEARHSPLEADDERLLAVAEMLAKSVTFQDRNDECFTPSYGIDDESAYAYDYEYDSEEEYTVLSTWCIIKRASLPVDTFCLASLILKELGPRFYREWSFEMDVLYRGRHRDRTRELIIVAACIIAQKFLHDAIYTLTTWTTICCKPRPDINNKNLYLTERLILKEITWSVNEIANEQTVANLYDQTMDRNPFELQRKYPQLYYTDDGDDCDAKDGEGCDSPYYYSR